MNKDDLNPPPTTTNFSQVPNSRRSQVAANDAYAYQKPASAQQDDMASNNAIVATALSNTLCQLGFTRVVTFAKTFVTRSTLPRKNA